MQNIDSQAIIIGRVIALSVMTTMVLVVNSSMCCLKQMTYACYLKKYPGRKPYWLLRQLQDECYEQNMKLLAVCHRPHQGFWLCQQKCTLGCTMQNWLSWHSAIICALVFASDCALMAHMLDDLLELMDCYVKTSKHFGLIISLMKTKVMYRNSSNGNSIFGGSATITVDNSSQ